MPEISVIVPVYKVEKYLDKCVKSILNQTFGDFELFLVDDGSPDRCPEMCDEWAKNDSRIKVIHKKNGGLSDARNVALDVMTGKYVCFVDSDDWIPDDSLQTMYDAIIDSGADLAIGNMIGVTEDGETFKQYWPAEEKKVETGKNKFYSMNQPCAQNRLYKSYIFQTLRFPVGKLYEDAFVFHHILENVESIVFTGKTNYFYLIRSNSIMRNKYTVRNMDLIEAVIDQADTLDKNEMHEMAMEKRMFIYSQLSAAYAFLDKSDTVAIKRREEFVQVYKRIYPELMYYQKSNNKQRIRLFLLRYFPELHTLVWGRKMPISLG